MKAAIAELEKSIAGDTAKLEQLKAGTQLISKEERDAVQAKRDTAMREWKRRKRMVRRSLYHGVCHAGRPDVSRTHTHTHTHSAPT